MEAFSSSKFWDERYKKGETSGAGSYGVLCDFKNEILNNFIKENEITELYDMGYGDGNQIEGLKVNNYIGLDVSPTACKMCNEKYKGDETKKFHLYMNTPLEDMYKKRDLAISLDVIYHLVEDDVYNMYMKNLFNLSKKYVVIYSNDTETNLPGRHMRCRKFTDYVNENYPEWKLLKKIKNQYPELTSADFYIYIKKY